MLEARLRAATTEQRQLLGIRIVLEAAEGSSTREIARELDTTPATVSLWRGRYAREGLDGLADLPRSGAPSIYGEATDQRIRAALDEPPPKGFARWSGLLIAEVLGDVDVQYVCRSLRKQKKPSIQALEGAQCYQKLPNGRALTGHSHDYKRHGTSC